MVSGKLVDGTIVAATMTQLFADLSIRAWATLSNLLVTNVIVAKLEHCLAEIAQLIVRVLRLRATPLADATFDSMMVRT